MVFIAATQIFLITFFDKGFEPEEQLLIANCSKSIKRNRYFFAIFILLSLGMSYFASFFAVFIHLSYGYRELLLTIV